MKPARLVVLAIALGSAGIAAFLMARSSAPPAPVVIETAAPAPRSVDVLVAAGPLPVGQSLKPADTRWQAWPADNSPPGAITRTESPNGLEATGWVVRQSFLAGEPMRADKLIRTDGSGFMSAILPTGMRAMAIAIDTRGATSAGGFILPNDRVDILRTFRDDEASRAGGLDVQVSETVMPNIRVLAIGQTVQERAGEKVVTGETATLEVTPVQAERLALAQKNGQLSLILRSLADAKGDAPREDRPEGGLTIVRYGVGRTMTK